MAGRVVLAIAFLAVVGAAAVGFRLLFDDGSGDDPPAGERGALPVADCEPVAERAAREARRAFLSEHVRRDRRPRWFNGIGTTTADLARDAIEQSATTGRESSELSPAIEGGGSVLMVMFDPAHDLPDLPGCIEGTPVLYLGSGPVQQT